MLLSPTRIRKFSSEIIAGFTSGVAAGWIARDTCLVQRLVHAFVLEMNLWNTMSFTLALKLGQETSNLSENAPRSPNRAFKW